MGVLRAEKAKIYKEAISNFGMANEAVLLVQKSIPISMTVADGTGIEKGTVLKLSDPNTAAAATALNDTPGGFAYTEKIASDGITKLAVIRGPGDRMKVKISGAVTAGDALAHSGTANFFISVAANISGSKIYGTALETGADNESIEMEVNIR